MRVLQEKHNIFNIYPFKHRRIGQKIVERTDVANEQEQLHRDALRTAHLGDAFVAETEVDSESRQHPQQTVIGLYQVGHLHTS